MTGIDAHVPPGPSTMPLMKRSREWRKVGIKALGTVKLAVADSSGVVPNSEILLKRLTDPLDSLMSIALRAICDLVCAEENLASYFMSNLENTIRPFFIQKTGSCVNEIRKAPYIVCVRVVRAKIPHAIAAPAGRRRHPVDQRRIPKNRTPCHFSVRRPTCARTENRATICTITS
jgi:hypothetical protein